MIRRSFAGDVQDALELLHGHTEVFRRRAGTARAARTTPLAIRTASGRSGNRPSRMSVAPSMNQRLGVTRPTARNALGMASGFIIEPPNRLNARMIGRAERAGLVAVPDQGAEQAEESGRPEGRRGAEQQENQPKCPQ
ncbi:MAG: hypothetical protein MZU91_11345 [Desulfosudis oleivorans]|nr:hypothetical protein [Desulfosudis oleivorans]